MSALPPGFDPQPVLRDGPLDLRPMRAQDIPALAQIGANPVIWQQHPAKDRATLDGFTRFAQGLLAQGGTLVAWLDGAPVGMSSFYGGMNAEQQICIGYTFLAPAHWGGGVNGRMKRLMITHGFAHAPELWFHIAPENRRSQVATMRNGAVHRYDMEKPGGEIVKCYSIRRAQWQP